MTSTITLTAAQQHGQHVYHLIQQGHKGAALLASREGWRDFPTEVLAETPSGPMTFEKLTVILSAELGEEAAPAAAAEPQTPAVAQVSAPSVRPVSPAPIRPVPAPVSAVPVSVAPVTTTALVIERTANDGTILTPPKGAPKLLPLIGGLGWNWAKRGFLYLGDRDTAPNLSAIAVTIDVLRQHGIEAVSTVTGAEPPRPVSAPPARPVSAAPARKPAGNTRRQNARKASPVEVRYVQPVSAAPVAAPQPPVFQAPAAAPVSAAPVVAPAGMDPAIAMLAQQLQQMQAQMAAFMGQPAPVAAAPAPVVEQVAPVSPATVSAEEALAMLVDTKRAEVLAKVESLTWQFRLADGANARHTAREIRHELSERVGGWWAHHHLGSVTFSVMVDKETPGVLHAKVNFAAGDITPSKLSEQVVGTVLTVRGIKSRSTTKRDA